MLYFSEVDNIYFEKSKEYFKEVLSSFESGNYRSSMVMLYSVIISDLLYKLQELANVYNEACAKEILNEVETYKSNSQGKSKSNWEMELVRKVNKRTDLLDNEMYEQIDHIHKLRNFSAHPALNNDYELYRPSKEETIACIKCILEKILVIPPVFIKNITNTLLSDLSKNDDIYQNTPEELRRFLKEKYYKRMSVSKKEATFKTLWKKCFVDENDDGIRLKRKALGFLFEDCNESMLRLIKKDNSFNKFSDSCLYSLCGFLAEYPSIYDELDDATKFQIKSKVDKIDWLYLTSWFVTGNKKAHLANMISRNKYDISVQYISYDFFKYLYDIYSSTGDHHYLIDYCIELFGRSPKYAESRDRYKFMLKIFLKQMTKGQYIRLIEVINSNDQIWEWEGSFSMNTEIVKIASNALGLDFDFGAYNNFRFSSKVLNNENDSNVQQGENL